MMITKLRIKQFILLLLLSLIIFLHITKKKEKKIRRETNLNESNFLVLFDKINFYIKPTKNKNKNRIETEENPRKRKVRFTSRVF